MPEETPVVPPTGDQPDIKAKLGTIESTVAQLAETNKQLAQQLAKMQQKPKPITEAPTKSLGERFYEDENAVLQEVEANATKRATDQMRKLQETDRQKQAAVTAMVTDYPELAIEGDLKKRSVEIFNAMSEEDQADPKAIKLSVREAAAELGLLPKNKRKDETVDDDDSFSLSGRGNSDGRKSRKSQQKEGDLAQETLDFAELLGRPVDDEKYIERLKKANQRRNWGKFKPVKGK